MKLIGNLRLVTTGLVILTSRFKQLLIRLHERSENEITVDR